MLRISGWIKGQARAYVLNELRKDPNSLPKLSKKTLSGYAGRNNRCDFVKTCILGLIPG